MPKLTATELSKAKMDLTNAGCTPAMVDCLVAAPGINASIIAALLNWIAAHPNAISDVWSFLQLILPAFTPTPAP